MLRRGGPFGVRPASLPALGAVVAAFFAAAAPGALLAGAVGAALLAGTSAAAASPVIAHGPLADSVAAAVAELDGQADVGALAVSLDRGDTLFGLNEDRRLIPGSNTKIFTTAAFLRRYGPSARFTTTIEARGRAEQGKKGVRLKGALVLRPAGVPDVTQILAPGSKGLLDSLAVLLRAGGLERFEGTLWVDGTLFADEGYGPGWAVEDVPWSYGTLPNAVMANGNAATLTLVGGSKEVDLALDPPETPIAIASRPALLPEGAAGAVDLDRALGSRWLRVAGAVPRGVTLKKQLSVPEPDSAAGLWLLGAMRRAGIEVKRAEVRLVPRETLGAGLLGGAGGSGGAPGKGGASGKEGAARERAAAADTGWAAVRRDRTSAVLTLLSPPASAMIGVVHALSLNAEADALLHLLDPSAREKRRAAGLIEARRAAAGAGVDTLDLSLVDGSGLSPQNLATARALAAWLVAMHRDSTLAAPFREGLAGPGENGTLRRRFPGLDPGANLRAKTGTLTNVSSLSGYVTSASGERIAFAVITNGNRGSTTSAKQLEERLVGMLARRGGEAAGMTGSPPPRIPR
ncbi:MAG TPA: D-alanyl-D-alanine carboxypeptidase [Candidatus Binatia bacterium]|nr:D-alanyl-D-alanine carboxypeptidase [Candidatus Binatia bacterium]